MLINSGRFGELDIDEHKIIHFTTGMPGLEHLSQYILLHHDETRPINWLQSIEEPELSLPVIDPFEVVGDYVFDISDEDISDLSINGIEDVHVVNVLVIPESIQDMTINLVAPILINIRLNKAKQIIIDENSYSIRHPIFEAIYDRLKEEETHAGVDSEGK